MHKPFLMKANSWEDVDEFYTRFALGIPQYEPMRLLVSQIASSEYSKALYPATSMHTMLILQAAEFERRREVLEITFDGASQQFHFRGLMKMIQIQRIESHQVEGAKRIIVEVCQEIWQWPVPSEEVLRQWNAKSVLSDIDDLQSSYFGNNGTFLVLVDDEQVVGTGAISRLSNDVCELKRMWLLKAYRGQGLGWEIAQALLTFAAQAGYKSIRLDLADETKQAQALNFYKRLGFDFIERYNDSQCKVFMEKRL